MPVVIRKLKGGKVRVSTDHVKAKSTTPAKAKRLRRLLYGVERGWVPTGQSARW